MYKIFVSLIGFCVFREVTVHTVPVCTDTCTSWCTLLPTHVFSGGKQRKWLNMCTFE